MTTPDHSPVTWVDVARCLAGIDTSQFPFPREVTAARVGWFGLLLQANAPVEESAIADGLETLFPSRVRRDPLRIELDGGQDNSELLVEIEIESSNPSRRQPFGVVDGLIDFRPAVSSKTQRAIPIAAALSVKGGTGRTTTAVAFALHWAETAKRPILLVCRP